MRPLAGIAALGLAAAALAQDAPFDPAPVHAAERARFGYGELRPGADGNDPAHPNYANFDEAKVGELEPPPLFSAETDRTESGWQERRRELAHLIEQNWVGKIPDVVAEFRIDWEKEQLADAPPGATVERWRGTVTAPDGSGGPAIEATITFPAAADNSPALIFYTYQWPGGREPQFGGQPLPDPVPQALEHGFVHVAYYPQALQADTGATMAEGVIGLARWPRAEHDWGALRAWAWGVSRLREELAADPRINPARISLTGHSRFGKGVLVAAAFDHSFADAHVSSSGAGGAKLMRRDFGERWENMAGSYAFHWYTPAAMKYARQGHSVAELPVDAHMLIALRAPRPLFITSGLAEKGDGWVDPRGMWIATRLARPAWAIYGHPAPSGRMPEPQQLSEASYRLGWYQHGEGHVPWPAYEAFYAHEARFSE